LKLSYATPNKVLLATSPTFWFVPHRTFVLVVVMSLVVVIFLIFGFWRLISTLSKRIKRATD